ncbi:MAG: S46 family peptidase [Bacteroidales bacterium]|nr:S46 family peptidase [Bacteroidales bacterium]
MKRVLKIVLVFLLSFQLNVRADEGMWLLSLIKQLNMDEMKEMGLKLTAEQIYSVNNASLKDAVGALDYGSCTAELISGEGLLLTNHHCGYGEIQYHSSVEYDYLKDGFWAMTREEELPNEGKTISFLVRMEEVTDQVMTDLVDEMGPDERVATMREVIGRIRSEATAGTHYEAQVRPMFAGNRYFLFVIETFRDVRLVGAPPESIGKFGADTDNWMWPRHTGDFALFRVYTGPDGKPADYSPENIPLKPKHYLPVSLNGYDKGDFSMVLGFPGGTDRYMTSYEVQRLLDIEHPNRIKIRGIKQDIMMADMQADPKVRLQYADKYSTSSNYWKYSIGQSQGLRNLQVVDKKKAQEAAFELWVHENQDREEMYGDALEMIRTGVEESMEYEHAYQYLMEGIIRGGMESVWQGFALRELHAVLSQDEVNQEALAAITAGLKESAADFYKDYNAPTDKKIMKAMLHLLLEDVDEQYLPDFVAQVNSKYKGNVDKYVDKYFDKSMIVDQDRYMAFLDDPSLKQLEKDPTYLAVSTFFEKFNTMRGAMMAYSGKMQEGSRLYIKGLIEMYPGRDFYPDANSTMRLTYGSVGDYEPRDAVLYEHYTTLEGVMEKEDPDNYEFVVSPKLKELYKTRDYGKYGMNGTMPVCFTTNNDITGGNSGSPVINGKGELIGLAFDGNWEAMSGDVAFEPELQKCINVDIRYVLFVIDKYAGATHLVEEMQLVR